MAKVKIVYKNKAHNRGSIKLNRLSRKMRKLLPQSLKKIGAILEEQIKRNLSGPSHTRFPGNGNPFPGTLSGGLKSSVNFQIRDGGLTVVIGPNKVYGAIQEFGGRNIPDRPYVIPALDKKEDEIVNILFGRVTRALN